MDTYTRYVELYPTMSTSANELASTFYEKFVLRHGVPTEVLSDNGAPFTVTPSSTLSRAIYENAKKYDFNILYTDNDTIAANWDQHIRIIQFVHNTTINNTTQHSPFYLTHGRNPRTPLVIAKEGQFVDHYTSPTQQYVTDLQDRLNLAFDLVDQLKPSTSQVTQASPYVAGDLVLVFNQAHTTKNKPRKLSFDLYGPLEIIDTVSKSSYNLKYPESSKTLKNVHMSRMKKYHQQSSDT